MGHGRRNSKQHKAASFREETKIQNGSLNSGSTRRVRTGEEKEEEKKKRNCFSTGRKTVKFNDVPAGILGVFFLRSKLTSTRASLWKRSFTPRFLASRLYFLRARVNWNRQVTNTLREVGFAFRGKARLRKYAASLSERTSTLTKIQFHPFPSLRAP